MVDAKPFLLGLSLGCGLATGREIGAFVRRLVGAIRALWPKVEILLRADSHYAGPQVFDWCRANGVDRVFGLAPNSVLSRHIAALKKCIRRTL